MFDTFLQVIAGALILCAFPMFCALGFAWVVAVVHERATRKGGKS